ncbi:MULTISPECIES: DUF1149 family protein [unclassified Lactococcus]|uniref:DUF1149 family protein n=1 Tax=unclassified Lactococcus TaxID=2643510 RepID=UPI0011CCDCE1|nr:MULTISPECIES: DUF1149 family protein [unclassified Lactococcus]MQW23191.1 DUF1149 family protein [Lactococcus sp. dk101]TXK44241.1 DUF1149 family protein [Lactococcus sp. dk310]TXK49972.1 DUF1149 family protein [Lactococcus sp. dk322]
MTLVIEREQEFVNQFHYDARNYEWEKENGTPETSLNVQFQLVPVEQLEKANDGDTGIHTILTFMIPLENIVISGFVSQLNYVRDRKIEEQDELVQEEMTQLASPLFDLLKRMVYETTEVALDQPGIQLEF